MNWIANRLECLQPKLTILEQGSWSLVGSSLAQAWTNFSQGQINHIGCNLDAFLFRGVRVGRMEGIEISMMLTSILICKHGRIYMHKIDCNKADCVSFLLAGNHFSVHHLFPSCIELRADLVLLIDIGWSSLLELVFRNQISLLKDYPYKNYLARHFSNSSLFSSLTTCSLSHLSATILGLKLTTVPSFLYFRLTCLV